MLKAEIFHPKRILYFPGQFISDYHFQYRRYEGNE